MPFEDNDSEKVYQAISKLPGLTYGGLAEQTGVPPDKVEEVVKRLEKKGLVAYDGDRIHPVSAEEIRNDWFKKEN